MIGLFGSKRPASTCHRKSFARQNPSQTHSFNFSDTIGHGILNRFLTTVHTITKPWRPMAQNLYLTCNNIGRRVTFIRFISENEPSRWRAGGPPRPVRLFERAVAATCAWDNRATL